MKALVCSVYDSKVNVFSQPMVMQNKGAALRAWEEASNDKSGNIGKYPADHTLFVIGEWDDETGNITMFKAKENLGTALEYVKKQWDTLRQIASDGSGQLSGQSPEQLA